MLVLVTGGAGYIGSVITETLIDQNHKVVVFDNLSQGHKKAVHPDADFVCVDICDIQALDKAFSRYAFDAVVHMAGETVVEYSSTQPIRYFQTNINGGINLLNIMLKYGVKKLIFSSTASIYGEPKTIVIDERHPKNPINVYGTSKLMFENILKWLWDLNGLKNISLRYFNASGASFHYGEDHRPETHLIPCIFKALLSRKNINVYGLDYPTKDGSCIRDYVHVLDIAQAHILALQKLDDIGYSVYNLGSGTGHSVLEVIKMTEKITGIEVPIIIGPKRSGDPSQLVASSDEAKKELGWNSKFTSIENIIESAWSWQVKFPNGYEE